jgi:coiled-coil domain-containing protein 130
VRFNAEKKKVGNYYTTPVYSFRMKHVVCGGWIEIRTDPKNTAYVVVEGAKKRDTGEDKEVEGGIDVRTEEERERIRNDAFAALEGKVEDKRKAFTDNARVEELKRKVDKDWADPYSESQRLRRAFRAGRKVREKDAKATKALKERMGLAIDLLPEREEDKLRAGFVEFGSVGSDRAIEKARSRPLFEERTPKVRVEKASKSLTRDRVKRPSKGRSDAKKVAAHDSVRQQLAKDIQGSSRAVVDPFLNPQRKNQGQGKALSLSTLRAAKASKTGAATDTSMAESEAASRQKPTTVPLVDYDSD